MVLGTFGACDCPIVHGRLGGAKTRTEPPGLGFPGRCKVKLGEGGEGSNGEG